MRYCKRCRRRLTMEELLHDLGGVCWDCWLPKLQEERRLTTPEATADWWRSDEAMSCE